MSEQIKQESPTKPSTVDSATGPALPEETKTNTKLLIVMILIVVVVIALIVGFIAILANANQTQPVVAVFRDLCIVALALVSGLIGLLLMVLIFQVQSLIALLRNEIKPMLTNVNETVNTVRGTTVFVSDNLVKPTIGFASFVAGIKGVQQAFTEKVNSASKRSKPAGKAQATSSK
jgi:hypothetical protein